LQQFVGSDYAIVRYLRHHHYAPGGHGTNRSNNKSSADAYISRLFNKGSKFITLWRFEDNVDCRVQCTWVGTADLHLADALDATMPVPPQSVHQIS
jgi:hypothetical protein